MITIINLNASVDKRYEIEDIVKGKVMRARAVENTAGGKGLHVANVAHILGEDITTTGYVGGKTGEFIEAKLREIGIKSEFVKIKKDTRECLAFVTDDLVQTEILEPGPEVTEEEQEEFYKVYEKLLCKSNIIVASGSAPRNVPKDVYKKLIERANRSDKKFLLDTSGDLLKEGIEAKPFLIKPNKDELEMLTGKAIVNEKDIIDHIKILNSRGIKCVIVSLGAGGSLISFNKKIYKVFIPKVKAVNPVGSGDSLVGGFAVGLHRNYDIEKIIALASACGTANAMIKETGWVELNTVKDIMDKVKIEKY
ncbi:1-phosphofructokinase [Clostridium felsineum]|uniref:1-phosphofructokinase n=1 Tax=Clostridium felsineum TaxID=36839 RepID=UPI00098CB1E8|nr:1-phosphofructokinase family hexose kinase [Clostridium felsineum]URZ14945.1 Tagatose-6-phosphate kinase [Clostridium felsineum DSM 794]